MSIQPLADPDVVDDEPVVLEEHQLSDDELKAARRVVPPVTLPATLTDPSEAFVPPEVRRRAQGAELAGHRWALYRAIGPRVDQHGYVVDPQHRTLGLRIEAPGRRIVAFWGWRGDVAKPGWRFELGVISPGRVHEVEGTTYRLPHEKVGISIIDKAIKGDLE